MKESFRIIGIVGTALIVSAYILLYTSISEIFVTKPEDPAADPSDRADHPAHDQTAGKTGGDPAGKTGRDPARKAGPAGKIGRRSVGETGRASKNQAAA